MACAEDDHFLCLAMEPGDPLKPHNFAWMARCKCETPVITMANTNANAIKITITITITITNTTTN